MSSVPTSSVPKWVDPAHKAAKRKKRAEIAIAAHKAMLEGMKARAPNGGDEQQPRPPPLLLSVHDVCWLTGLSYPTLWRHICAGKFPRGRRCFGKTMWVRSEIESWIAKLPPQKLKGDQPADSTKETEPA
jgi:predicted DNA-binding transcriptional regulator AlpA